LLQKYKRVLYTPMIKYFFTTILLLLLTVSPAWGDSFLPRFIGGVDPGVPTDEALTGIVVNPAIIGKLRGTNVSIYYSPIFQNIDVQRSPILSLTGNPGPGADISFPNASYSNNIVDYFFAASTDFGMDRVTLGIAVYSPFRQNFTNTPAAIRYHLIDRDIMNLHVTPVVSLKLHRKFYFGFGLSYVYTKVNMEIIRDRFLRGNVPLGTSDFYEQSGKVDEKVVINTADSNLGFNLGFHLLIKKWLFLGGSYRSKIRSLNDGSVNTTGSGSITRWFDDSSSYRTLNGSAKMSTTFPDILNLGIKMRLSRTWWADFTTTWTRWSAHKSMKVLLSGNDFANSSLANWDLNITSYRGFQDVVAPQLTFFFNPKTGFKFTTSLRYNPPATPKEWVNPAAVDNHSIDFMLSTSFKVFDFITFRIAYSLEYMFPITIENSGFDPTISRTCLDNHIDVAWCGECLSTMNDGKSLPSAAGTYKKISHQIGFGIDIKF
jgi:long-subunit fatty acid transport protein